jgi:anti-sigma B factor antagonist
MTLRILENTGDLLFLVLDGSLDISGAREIETPFLAHVTSATGPVIVDFSGVTFLASFGMRMLFDAIKSLGRKGRKLIVLNPQPAVAQVLKLSGVNEVAVISYDEADARAKAH